MNLTDPNAFSDVDLDSDPDSIISAAERVPVEAKVIINHGPSPSAKLKHLGASIVESAVEARKKVGKFRPSSNIIK